ncbi:MAG: MFS transporter [Bacilli bacterium]|jgi:GPH family glycoside/pentoside/hexuronide:cation symporter|nr:MFS transporter [Bacilli bacterium]
MDRIGLLKRQKKTSPLGFAFFLFGLTLITQLFHAYNYPYYNLNGLIDIAWASVAKIIFVIADWLNDLIFGALSEKTKSKYGKRIPWLIWGSFFIPLTVILTYVVNQGTPFSPVGFAIYYIIISVAFENASTVMFTNYVALYPTLFVTNNERSKTSAYKHIFEALAMAGCYMLTPLLRDDLKLSYVSIGFIYSAVFFISLFIMLKSSRISDDVKAEKDDINNFNIKDTLKDAFTDKGFIFFNLAQSCFSAVLALVVTLYKMYFTYVLGGVQGIQESIIFGCLFGSVLIFIPFWKFIIGKIGFLKVWVLAYCLLPIFLLTFLLPNSYATALPVFSLVGVVYGALMISPDMIYAEIIDIDRIKHHMSREAALGSIANLIGRFSVILSTIATIILTQFTGYESGENPGTNPALTFRLAFGVMMPIIALIGTIFAFLYVKASRRDRIVLHELKRTSLENTTEVDISEIISSDASKKNR